MPGETKLDDLQHERHVYSYTYTSDGDDNDNPQTNIVKVTTTVEEETTPDGTKVIRKREESQQVSKVTKVEKITRVHHHHLMEPSNGESNRATNSKHHTSMKHDMSGGFLPNSSCSQYESLAKEITNGMKHFDLNNHNNETYSNGRNGSQQPFNGNGYNEPENNKSILHTVLFCLINVCSCSFPVNTDEKSMGYDPNDPNLVDEPDLDVENPYEGLGPGRPDPVSRVLMPTAGRQSPDSLGHGNSLFPHSFLLLLFALCIRPLLKIHFFSTPWLW